MTKPMRRTAAIVAAAAMSVVLSACTQGHWVYDAPPAAGVQADDGGVKLRGFVVIADPTGEAMLVGAVATRDEPIEVTGFQVTPQLEDQTFGEPQVLEFNESVKKGRTIYVDGDDTRFTNPDLHAGLLARVDVAFGNGSNMSLEVPVMSSEHDDFAQWWNDHRG